MDRSLIRRLQDCPDSRTLHIEAVEAIKELIAEIKMLEDLLKQDGTEKKTCKTCGNECQMIGLNMPACTSYKESSERK